MNKKLRVSIVIPVYNEAVDLAACLQAIAVQHETPYEVIVVDNNSTDATASVASSFPFVKLLHEQRQGVVHARTAGFNAARGDIIGRIDADTQLPPLWVSQVRRILSDDSIAAVSGAADYYDFALPRIANGIDQWCRRYLASRLGSENFLFGGNMAVRRSAWRAVRDKLCATRGSHEDFDLAIHLQELGFRVDYRADLVAGVSSRRIDNDFPGFVRYTLASPRTYARHNLSSRRYMYPVLFVTWVSYAPGRLVYRSIDPETGSFSWQRLMAFSAARIDPTANIA